MQSILDHRYDSFKARTTKRFIGIVVGIAAVVGVAAAAGGAAGYYAAKHVTSELNEESLTSR